MYIDVDFTAKRLGEAIETCDAQEFEDILDAVAKVMERGAAGFNGEVDPETAQRMQRTAEHLRRAHKEWRARDGN